MLAENSRLTLGLRNAGLDVLDLAGPKSSEDTLVLGTRELRPNGSFEIRDGSAGGGFAFASSCGRHLARYCAK